MTVEQIINYIYLKLEKLEKDKEIMLDNMEKQYDKDNYKMCCDEYLKASYAKSEIEDIKTFIQTGVNTDVRIKEKK